MIVQVGCGSGDMDEAISAEMAPFVRFAGRTWSGRGPDGAVADVSR